MRPPRIAELIEDGAARLRDLKNPRLDSELLLRGIAQLDRATILARPDDPVDLHAAERFHLAIARRARHEPVQYILGIAAFWRDEFVVSPAVLIPRPETEILVEQIASAIRRLNAPRVLDLGTGSGCIGLSLLREHASATLLATDASAEALAVAEENARRLGVSNKVRFLRSRWFEAISEGERFDAIVSNPPYVAPEDASSLAAEVRDHEPHLALFANREDDLSSYRAIIPRSFDSLVPGGALALEVGLGQAERVAVLLREAGFRDIETITDLASIPRVVVGAR